MRRLGWLGSSVLVLSALLGAAQDGDWGAYGRDAGGERFSPLDQIRRQNVASLQIAWTFRTGDAYTPKEVGPRPSKRPRYTWTAHFT
jgi:quinoprotein glucose dehydrogenase